MNTLEMMQEIKTKDHDGNSWIIRLSKAEVKTNRWQLSFLFNEKEFSLSKPQNNQAAQNMWELLQKIKITPKLQEELQEENKTTMHTERPKKRTVKN